MRENVLKSLEDSEPNKLPSLPHILVKLLQACRDEEICFETISSIISRDAALSARVISVANSPVYGRARHLSSLKHLLMFLGLDTIKSIAITAAVQQFFSRYSSKKNQFLKNFWRHSLCCATIGRSLARLSSYPYPEEAYLAGLLHDIGKLVFENLNNDYSELTRDTNDLAGLLELEHKQYGITHDSLGGHLLEKWNITSIISDAVRYHHADEDQIRDAHQLVKIIQLANRLTNVSEDENASVIECTNNLFDLNEALLQEIITESQDEMKQVAQSLDIDIGEDITRQQEQDEHKQIALAQEVRDIALTHSTRLPLHSSESQSLVATIQKCMIILFGVQESAVFLLDRNTSSLLYEDNPQQPHPGVLKDLQISLPSSSMLSQALEKKQIQYSWSLDDINQLTIVDRQIMHALHADALICAPISRNQQNHGVIVVGAQQDRQKTFLRHANLLQIFALEIAETIEEASKLTIFKQDITESKNMQFQHKAREIIHETSNPLGVIRNYLQILANRLGTDDPALEDISVIKEEIDRVGSIILRCAEDIDATETQEVKDNFSINQLIQDTVNIFSSSLFMTHKIKPQIDLDENAGTITHDRDTIKQIITNLIKNAIEAIGNDGNVGIKTRPVNINGKNFVDIEIHDNGPGIPDEIMNNLYKPVMTTKGNDHSGLGLSIVKNLIDSLGGFIGFRTGKTGTVFNVQIPKNN